jgi:hypothetical protein
MRFFVPRRGLTLGVSFTLLFAALALVATGGSHKSSADAATAAVTANGLVAAYSFDEGTGTNVADASGTGNGGTVTGATWSTAGKHGGALSFDGAGDFVTVADTASLDLSAAMTVEAWVFPTSLTGYSAIVAKERTGGGFPYGLETGAGVPDGYVTTGPNATAAATTALAANAWTHVAASYDGANVRLYVNGVLAATKAASGAIRLSNDALRIGGDVTWSEWFQGRIDDVRVYNRALTAAELGTDMNAAVVSSTPPPVSTLVAAYGFDEGTGATVADSSSKGNTGTISNAIWTASGRYGSALAFDGASDYVTVADSASLDLSAALTVEAWVFPTTGTGYQGVVAKERTGGGLPYGLEAGNGVPDGYVNTGSNSTAAGTTAPLLNAWTHLAVTYDGTNVRLYTNGTLTTATPASGTIVNSADPLRIGGDLTWGEWFAGRIDDVRIYSRALSAAEIQTDLNTPIGGGTVPPPPPPTGDTTPPTVPTGLAVSSKTQTSVSLTWGASTDHVGVAGYGSYNGATRVSQATGTSSTISGLVCGTTYTLGADAYDAAGNRSTKATMGAATTACPTPTGGNVFLSPNGSDTNSCSQSAPCKSFNRGYHAAGTGQVVEIAGGTYSDQNILYDSSKGTSADVTFQPAAGASVFAGQIDFGSNRFEGGASHVTIRDITLNGDVAIPGCGVPDNTPCGPDASAPGTHLTFLNLRVRGIGGFYCASCSDVSLIGGTWGPDTYNCHPGYGSLHPEVQSAYTQVKRAHRLLIDGTTWQNFARCTTADHTECLQVEPADDLTIRNSVFKQCDTITVNIANDLANANSVAGFRAPNNVLVENNFFDTAKDWTGGPTYYALNIRECSNCTVRYNSWSQAPRMPTGETALNDRYTGNLGPYDQWACMSEVTYSRNVFVGAACSASDKNVGSAGFVNAGAVDLHLAAGSPAIDAGDPGNYPTRDIDGQARPLGGAPDAGADERQ